MPATCTAAGRSPRRDAGHHRHRHAGRAERRDDAHRRERERLVEGAQRHQHAQPGERPPAPPVRAGRRGAAGAVHAAASATATNCETSVTAARRAARAPPREEVAHAPGERRAEREGDRSHAAARSAAPGPRAGSVQPRAPLQRVEVVRAAHEGRRRLRAEVPPLRPAAAQRCDHEAAVALAGEHALAQPGQVPPAADLVAQLGAQRRVRRVAGEVRAARAGRRRRRTAARDRPRTRRTCGARAAPSRAGGSRPRRGTPRRRPASAPRAARRHRPAAPARLRPSMSAVSSAASGCPQSSSSVGARSSSETGSVDAAGREPTRSPRDQRHARRRLEEGHLVPEPPLAQQLAVVGGEEHDGVVGQARLGERAEHLADALVDVGRPPRSRRGARAAPAPERARRRRCPTCRAAAGCADRPPRAGCARPPAGRSRRGRSAPSSAVAPPTGRADA